MRTLGLLILAVFFSGPAFGQECSQLLNHGIYDVQSSSGSLNAASSFSQWFCDENFSSAQEANSFGASLAFPFKNIPIKLGLDSSSSGWGESYSRFCSQYKQDASLQVKVKQHLKTASTAILSAFNACVASTGLHVWLERSHSPMEFVFAARFNPPNKNVSAARIEAFDAGSNVRCTDEPTEIDASVFRTRCTRKGDQPVLMVVRADWTPVGGGRLLLPEISRAKAPQPAAQVCSCVGHGGVQGVRFWGPRGEPCNGISDWGTYSAQCQAPGAKRLCKCSGHGGVEGVTLWGPEGYPCGGMSDNAWGTYSAGCVEPATQALCSCKGNGNVIGGMDLWGPKDDFCAGFDGWGRYTAYCK
jgi:hypothetical protein